MHQANSSDIYVESTAVDRTLQSGYAEIMGMYPTNFVYDATIMADRE